MKIDYIEMEIRAVRNRISSLHNQRQALLESLRRAYQLTVNYRESQELLDNYRSLRISYKKLQREISSLERRRLALEEDRDRHLHQHSNSRLKLVGISLFAIFLLFASISYIQPESFGITGYATSATQKAISNVTITKNVAIQANNLNEIIWSTELTPNTNDNPAEHNSDGDGGSSTYYISMAPENSIDVDFCINATDLTSGADTIGITNYTYSNSTTSNPPSAANSEALSETFVKHIEDVTSSQSIYYRFWLDVPAQQEAGTYTNNITFKVIESGVAC